MCKFTLNLWSPKIELPWIIDFNEVASIRRNFQSIDVHLSNSTKYLQMFLELIRTHGYQVRSLKLKCDEAMSFLDFSEVFKYLPMLEELKIFNCSIEISTISCSKVLFHKLKILEINDLDCSILENFSAPELTSLSINDCKGTSCFSLIIFLLASTRLKTLTFINSGMPNIFCTEMSQLNLKTLQIVVNTELFSRLQLSDEICFEFIQFLESQTSLVELRLEGFELNEVVTTIFNYLKQLKTLCVGSRILPNTDELYDQLEPSQSLKEIEFHKDFWGTSINKILNKCPELESLKLNIIKPVVLETLTVIEASNPKIKALSITSFDTYIRTDVKFNFLHSLEITEITNTNFLHSILRMNPTIENVTMQIYEVDFRNLCEKIFEDRFLNILTYHPGVRQCKVITKFNVSTGNGFEHRTKDLTTTIFDMLRIKLETRPIDLSAHLSRDPNIVSYILMKFPEKIVKPKNKTCEAKKVSWKSFMKIHKVFSKKL